MDEAEPKKAQSVLALLLRPFAKVEPSEAGTALILTSTVFLLLTAYYFLKTAREPLILLGGGAEVKSYAAGGQALLLLVFIRAYGGIARRLGRLKLLVSVYLFFAVNLLVFAVLAAAGFSIGVPFYLWVGVFNYTSIAQFWAFAADVYAPEQGKRLFAILGIGSSLGAVLGARVARTLAALGPAVLMLAATALLVVCVLLVVWADRRSRRTAGTAPAELEAPLSQQSAFALLSRDRFLVLLALLTLLLNWANSNGEYLLDRTLLATLADTHDKHAAAVAIGRFKADYFGWVNLVGVVLQLFVVSRVLTRLGPRVALFFLPVVALGGYTILLVAPVLSLIRLAKIAENSIDYSIENTVRQALYLVATREEKYVGKTAVDSLFVRLGDVLSALTVWVGARLAFAPGAFAAINLVLLTVVLIVVVALGREHQRRSARLADAAPRRAFAVPGLVGVTLLVGLALHAGQALAGPAPERPRPAPPPKRALPDYDGRGPENQDGDGAGTWALRILLSPVYALHEYGIRRPLGGAIASAERAHVPERLYDFFLFGPDHKAGILPIGFVDFGFKPSIGIYAFYNDAFFDGHNLSFHGMTGGAGWWAGVLSERFPLGAKDSLTVRFAGVQRPDRVFFGIGPDTVEQNRSRYAEDRLESSIRTEVHLWRASAIRTELAVRSVGLHHGHFAGDPSLEERAATGAFPIPYGFDRGYTAIASRVSAVLDTRQPRPLPGSGFRVDFQVEEGSDVRRDPGSNWLKYGATAAAMLDVNGRNRVLGVSLTTLFVDPLTGEIPFTELVSLGGDQPMPSFRAGRLLDRSAAVATVGYRWPIWVWLDGALEASAGNVFGDHLESFSASRLRFAGAIGVESVSTGGSRDGAFQMLLGVGTETIDQGARVDSVRFAIGTSRGF